MIYISIPGEAVGKGRPKFSTFNGRAVAYTPEKTVNYENLVKICYKQQCSEKPFDKDVQLKAVIIAYFAIPKATSKKKRELMLQGFIRPTKRPDLDNVVKACLDALNGIAYYDDSQIVELSVAKEYSEEPRTELYIREFLKGSDTNGLSGKEKP